VATIPIPLFASYAQAKVGARLVSQGFINGNRSVAPGKTRANPRGDTNYLGNHSGKPRAAVASAIAPQPWHLAIKHKRRFMDTINGALTITYNPRKEIYTLSFGPASSADARSSAHSACLPNGRSCGKVRVNLADAVQFLQTAGKPDPAELLAKTRIAGGTSVQVSITRNQHGALLAA
jgi:hypothetical protein